MKRMGSCHCQGITFEVETELEPLMRCNCSICGRAGTLMTFVPRTSFRQLSGEALYVSYTFGKASIDHGFCKVCGVRPFSRSTDADTESMMINVGCLEDVNVGEVGDVHVYDGASL